MCASPAKTPRSAPRRDVTKAIVVDSTPLVRLGLIRVCDTESVDVVAEFSDLHAALASSLGRNVEFVIVGDIDEGDRINATRKLKNAFDSPQVIWLIDQAEGDEIAELIQLEVGGLLRRSVDGGELSRALRAMRGGERFIQPAFISAAQGDIVFRDDVEAEHSDSQLTTKEMQVLKLLAAGHSNNELCEALFINLPTVKTHLAHIYKKLDVKRRSDAVSRALALGLLR